MKCILAALCVACFTLTAYSQSVQWAVEVIDFSSELTPVQYSAQQILYEPNVLPAGGDNPNAWTPGRENKHEFVKVGFENPIYLKQIAIAESHNPTALSRIFIYDEQGNEHLINTFNPHVVPTKGRMMNIFLEKTTFKVNAVKMEFDGAATPDYFSIDAIGISDSHIPITAQISFAKNLNKEIHIERLNENVNSPYNEYKPLISPDGKTLYFSRKRHPDNSGGEDDLEDIWFSVWDSLRGEWTLARNLDILNNKGPNFISSITPDGKAVILLLGNRYFANGNMMAGVSISSNESGTWSRPIAIEIKNAYNFSEKANFFLAANRKVLFLSIERKDTQGGRDLYASFLQPDSTWSEPVSLGAVVNSAGEESSPFLAADDQSLYFSSTGFSGFGGADIYVSKRLDDTWTNWSEPENLGPRINSELEDLFFNIPASGDYAYYSRTVNENNADIFRVKMPLYKRPNPVVIVRGKLLNAKTNEVVNAKIIYERLPDGKELGIAKPDPETGEFQLILPAGVQYSIRAAAEGFVAESMPLDLRSVKDYDVTLNNKNLLLVPIEEKAIVTLNSVFFDFDKAVLKQESLPELRRIIKLLNERPSMRIAVAGHTDAIGTQAYNLRLSKRRATSVSKYLLDEGIRDERIVLRYFGEAKPVATNDTAEGRKVNRRVEFEIIKD